MYSTSAPLFSGIKFVSTMWQKTCSFFSVEPSGLMKPYGLGMHSIAHKGECQRCKKMDTDSRNPVALVKKKI